MENKMMIFPELVAALSNATGTSESLCEVFLKELIAAVGNRLKSGESVELKGIGLFAVESGKISFTADAEVASTVNAAFECFEPIELADGYPDNDEAPSNEVEESESRPEETPALPPIPHTDDDDDDELPPPIPEEFLTESAQSGDDAPQQPENTSADAKPELKQPPTLPSGVIAPPLPDIPSTEDEQVASEEDADNQTLQEDESTSGEETEQGKAEEVGEEYEPQEGDNETEYYDEDDEEPRQGKAKTFVSGLLCGIVLMVAVAAIAYWLGYLNVPTYNSVSQSVLTDTVKTVSAVTAADSTALSDSATKDTDNQAANGQKKQTEEQYFTVTETAYLSNISRKYYGHYAFWVYIYIENKDIIKDPDNLPVGAKLRIPAPEKYGIDKNDAESIHRAELKALEIKSR